MNASFTPYCDICVNLTDIFSLLIGYRMEHLELLKNN